MCHMKAITIRELHEATGKWVRQATADGQILVTERGKIIAMLVPASPPPAEPYFARRRLLPQFEAVQTRLAGGTDSTKLISDERDREIP